MREYTRGKRGTWASVAALTLVLATAACGGDKNDALETDDALGRDLALAGQDSVQPQLQDVPVQEPPVVAPVTPTPAPTPAPRPAPNRPRPTPPVATTPAPRPAPEPVAPKEGTIASGTTMRFVSNTKVCSGAQNIGDKFTARLSGDVTGTNGAALPAGSTGTFEVVSAKRAQNQNDNTYLTVRLVSVTVDGNVYPVQATTETAATERVRGATKATDAKKVAGGAILGAIAGQILGKDTKSTVVGAAAGAAAGTAAAVGTADFDTCLNSGALVTVQLDQPVTVKIG
jgi:outer membrane biosynthesis protein TonB